YVLPRAEATEIAEVPTSYRMLGDEATPIRRLAALPDAMRLWITGVERGTELSAPGEEGSPDDEMAQRNRFQDDLRAWRSEADRIAAGVDLLLAAQEAWQDDQASLAAA